MINLNKREKIEHPYPIFVVENIFDENFLTEIIDQFPKYENFIKFKKTMVNRRFLSNDNPDFYDFIKKNIFWQRLYKEINSQEFYDKILNILVDANSENFSHFSKLKLNQTFHKKNKLNYNLSYYIKELTQKVPRNKIFNYLRFLSKKTLYKNYRSNEEFCYLRFDISSASNGYFRNPHKDSDGTILAFLIYLEDQINIGGFGGEFVVHNQNMEIFKKFVPKKNQALFFLSNQNSFHSVSKIINANGWRKFIYGGYTSTDKNIWTRK